jgi:hypothetical protein
MVAIVGLHGEPAYASLHGLVVFVRYSSPHTTDNIDVTRRAIEETRFNSRAICEPRALFAGGLGTARSH